MIMIAAAVKCCLLDFLGGKEQMGVHLLPDSPWQRVCPCVLSESVELSGRHCTVYAQYITIYINTQTRLYITPPPTSVSLQAVAELSRSGRQITDKQTPKRPACVLLYTSATDHRVELDVHD